jgi:hypothetical protein
MDQIQGGAIGYDMEIWRDSIAEVILNGLQVQLPVIGVGWASGGSSHGSIATVGAGIKASDVAGVAGDSPNIDQSLKAFSGPDPLYRRLFGGAPGVDPNGLKRSLELIRTFNIQQGDHITIEAERGVAVKAKLPPSHRAKSTAGLGNVALSDMTFQLMP